MCEIVAAAWQQPRPFADLAARAAEVERLGLGGFGWGVAWLSEQGVQRVRGLGRFTEEGLPDPALGRVTSTRFLLHLRRPSRLSTISLADTQPFTEGTRHAWCHNGFLNRADELRPRWAGRLSGRADSEVGWLHFIDRRAAGADTAEALRSVDATFGGHVNLAYLGDDGELAVYAQNVSNHMWRFELPAGAFPSAGAVVSTALHSDDDTLFTQVFPEATDRQRLAEGTALVLAPADAPALP